jgi:hypothetical protein
MFGKRESVNSDGIALNHPFDLSHFCRSWGVLYRAL